MIRKFCMFLLFGVLLVLGTADCSQPVCTNDDSCGQGKLCMQGECRSLCTDQGDCLSGEYCHDKRCKPGTPPVEKTEAPQDTSTPEPVQDAAPVESTPEAEPVQESQAPEPTRETEPVVEKAPPEKHDPNKCRHVAEPPLKWQDSKVRTYRRHELAENFTLKLQTGKTWEFKKNWTGCDSYIFIPDTLKRTSHSTSPSVWDTDLDNLIARSPKNVYYFFIGRSISSSWGPGLKNMQARIDRILQTLPQDQQDHWKSRIHVVATPASSLSGWMRLVATNGVGSRGFAIDRFQRLRGLGSLADVTRFKKELQAQKMWPWEANLAYAANEAIYYNFEAKRQARLDAEKVTEVKFWKGQVISQFAEMEVELPSAADMAKFDTLELDVTQRCPKDKVPEAGNCGAWDYLAHFSLKTSDGKYLELARLITTYHREGRWIADITPMLVRLAKGGKQTFRWLWAPKWNKQPTATWLSLRFSNRNKGIRPTQLVPLFTGGKFDPNYNKDRKPKTVPIPKTAKKVQLWALISGHGQSNANCAEFCNHQHRFVVNGKAFLQEYPKAGAPDDCMKRIDQGVVPNQWGTWWLGRGGWCPGQQVPPYIADLTQTAPAGKDAVVSYTGLFRGNTPPTQTKTGNINLQSYLVVYE